MKWYTIKNLSQSDLNVITADVHVPPDSPWFSGHFPGKPILPGIAQLAMAFDVINQSGNRNLKISSVRRVRFKQIIEPDDRLKIVVTPAKEKIGSYAFRIMVGEELVCSGIMTVEELEKMNIEHRTSNIEC